MDRISEDPDPAVIIEDRLRIPAGAHTLAGFRAWLTSGRFPEGGRIDFLAGDVEVEVSPAELPTHGAVQAALAARLHTLFFERDLGEVFAGRTRFTSRVAELSAEPDLVGVFWDSLEEGRVRYSPAADEAPERCAEIDGPPDLIVEILSDGSARKDTERLPRLYALAGVRELWLVDARGPQLRFEIHALHGAAYLQIPPDAQGWLRSEQLGRSVRLTRQSTHGGTWRYLLEDRA
jgi:Uma2 family endonuclease